MKQTITMLAALALMLCATSCGTKQEVKQEPETAAEAVKKMTAGWCLGNDMDCFDTDIQPGAPLEEYEKSWGQSPANELLFKKLAEKGFDAIRVPVTWWQHMDADGLVDAHPGNSLGEAPHQLCPLMEQRLSRQLLCALPWPHLFRQDINGPYNSRE